MSQRLLACDTTPVYLGVREHSPSHLLDNHSCRLACNLMLACSHETDPIHVGCRTAAP
jgi:hypothetical protein